MIAKDDETGRVKVHYVGWSEEYDEWKEDVVDVERHATGGYLSTV